VKNSRNNLHGGDSRVGKVGGGGCGKEKGWNNGRQETGHRKQTDLKTWNGRLFLH